MLKQALNLWKNERNQKGTSLYRRLVLFFVLVSVALVLGFTLLLTVFGITGKGEKALQTHLDTELSIIVDAIEDDFGNASLNGLTIAESIAKRCDDFFDANNINAEDLAANPQLIEPLLAEQSQILISTVNSRYCGGAFILLDATVLPNHEAAETSRAGIFLKKTQPTATDAVGVNLHYLRGPAQIARDNKIMLLGQWKMEYDITEQAFFTHVMETARANPDLPLSRLYYWSGRVTLKGNSESGFLLCVPLRSDDGFVFGLCGIEVSDRLFKSLYSPEGGTYENIFTIMAPSDEQSLYTSRGMIAGNYHLTGSRWDMDLSRDGTRDGFEHFSFTQAASFYESYGGISSSIQLYPHGSPYAGESWSVAIIMPDDLLQTAIKGSMSYFIYIVIALLVISVVLSILISRRYLRPVNDAFYSIRNRSNEDRKDTPFLEINDLFEFLEKKDREHGEEISKLNREKSAAQSQYDQAQRYITHLSDQRMAEVDPDSYESFLHYLDSLTPKERMIFDLYLEGKKAKEIMEIANISQNTMKYHNKNIYSKLGVSSRKQLLEYATLMNTTKANHDSKTDRDN